MVQGDQSPDEFSAEKSPTLHRITHSELALWLQWVAASAVAYGVFFTAIAENALFVDTPLGYAAVGVAVGVIVGIMQWLLLRLRIPRSGWWFLATATGFGLGYAVVLGLILAQPVPKLPRDRAITSGLELLDYYYPALKNWGVFEGFPRHTLGYGAVGSVVAIMQWLVLRRQLYLSSWWILANAVAFAAGHAIGLPLGFAASELSLPQETTLQVFIIGALVGTLVGIVTGAMLVWLLRHRVGELNQA